MSESTIGVADASPATKQMRTLQQTINSQAEQTEVIILATGAASGGDTYDARQIRVLTSADIVTSILSDGTHLVQVRNSASLSTDYGLVTRNIPSGTQNVSIIGTPTVMASEGTNPWIVAGNVANGTADPGTAVKVPVLGAVAVSASGAPYTSGTLQPLLMDASFTGGLLVTTQIGGVDVGIVRISGGNNPGLNPNSSLGVASISALANAANPGYAENTVNYLSTDLSGRLRTSGTVSANQGSPNTLGNAWPVELTDGTNLAAVNNQGQQLVSLPLTPWQPPGSPVGGFGQSSWKGSW